MADWLDVMKGEMQAKRQVREWLGERRRHNLEIAQAKLKDVVRPVLERAAGERGWRLLESAGEGDAALRCGIYAPKPKAAFVEVVFDGVNPVAVLRRHPGGADAYAEVTAVSCDALDRETLESWIGT